jgi:hypothetical protein
MSQRRGQRVTSTATRSRSIASFDWMDMDSLNAKAAAGRGRPFCGRMMDRKEKAAAGRRTNARRPVDISGAD